MLPYVSRRIPSEDWEDVIQNAFERAWASARAENGPYLWLALKSAIADYYRRRYRPHRERVKLLREESTLEGVLQSDRLSESDKSLLDLLAPWRSEDSRLSLREVARRLGIRYSALRQRYVRALRRVQVELLSKWYEEADFIRLNNYRLPETLMAEVMARVELRGGDRSVFREAFEFPRLSAAIQNSIWALASLKDRSVVSFFKRQLTSDDLFRGTKTYVADALFGYCDPEVDGFVNRNYFGGLEDMRSRVFDHEERVPVGTPTIFDVRDVRIIGNQRSIDSERIQRELLGGDIDLHRAAAFALLRIAPDDRNVGGRVVDHLRFEWDETNAYYVTKFLMRVGLPKFPAVYANNATLSAVRAAAEKWPHNFYLKESAARISSSLA